MPLGTGHILSAWEDNFLKDATFSVTDAAEIEGYEAVNLIDELPTSAAKLDDATGMWVADCGAVVTPSIFALINHNFESAHNVQIRGYTSAPANLATAPQVTIAITLGALEVNNYRQDLWIDVAQLAPGSSYRYWAVAVTTAGVNDPALGEWWGLEAAGRVTLPNGFEKNVSKGPAHEAIRHQTYGGVALRTRKRHRTEEWEGSYLATNAVVQTITDLWRKGEGQKPILFIPDVRTSYVVMGEFINDLSLRSVDLSPHYRRVEVGIRQLTRGLYWTV